MKNLFSLLFFVFIITCNNLEYSTKLEVSKSFFIYQKPEYNNLQEANFPVDLIYPTAKIRYFVHLERTGIWSPDQYALLLEVENPNTSHILNFYKNIMKIKEWQILQSKTIKEKNSTINFINAQDFFNRNLSILIEDTKKRARIKIYIKKLTDE